MTVSEISGFAVFRNIITAPSGEFEFLHVNQQLTVSGIRVQGIANPVDASDAVSLGYFLGAIFDISNNYAQQIITQNLEAFDASISRIIGDIDMSGYIIRGLGTDITDLSSAISYGFL
jgi:hypothetical protein